MRASFRPDLEGLRAVAVASVVAEHTLGVPAGGWIGVDVFFVLSGFLITRGLLHEVRERGRIDYPAFIVRRARRILPAATLVVLVTVLAAWVVWFPPRAVAVSLDAVASLTSVQNLHLMTLGTSYFTETGPASPLQHYWSLAVEEQFYAVWPLLLILTMGALRGRCSVRAVVTIAALATIVCSVGWTTARGDAVGTYFDPAARAWELGVGALLAAVAPKFGRRGAGVAVALGLAVVLTSAFLVPGGVASPFPAVLPAVVGTTLVIAGGDRAPTSVTAPLRWRPVRFLGRISFSLYLWHLPLLVFARSLYPGEVWAEIAAAAVALVLSTCSYRWVERPFTRSRTTPERTGRVAEGRRRVASVRSGGAGRRVAAVVATPLLVAAIATQLLVPASTDPASAAELAGLPTSRTSAESWSAAELRRALRQPADPTTVAAALDTGFTTQFAPEMSSVTGCRNELTTPLDDAKTCGGPGPGRNVLVIGDSVAMSWMPTIRGALSGAGWNVRAIGFASCSPADAGRTPTAAGDRLCAEARARMLAEVERIRPDLVIVSNDELAFVRTIRGDLSAAADRWESSTRRLLDELADSSGQVVLLGAPPVGADPTACATRPTGIRACESSAPSAASRTLVAANQAAASARPDVSVVDVVDWFCADGACPVVTGGVLVRVDERHLTNAYAERLAGVLRQALPA